ncbi:nucleotide exchange factor GrpE [Saliphagus sp. GCM10025308]
MSEDEGATPTAQGVPAEGDAEPGTDTETDGDGSDADADNERPKDRDENVKDSPAGEDENEGVSDSAGDTGELTEAAEPAESAEMTPENGDAVPQTSDEIRDLLETLRGYDDEIARDVTSIVEMARDLNGTVTDQREELEDLSERVEAQAETIGDLQDQLEEREEELADREATIEEHEQQIEDLKGHVKRTQADFQNYKKRAKKRQEQLKERATEDLVGRLVGVRDNLKRALSEESGDVETLREGVEMTLREFDRVLAEENVEEIDPEPGTEVDPQRHEVMVQIDSDQPEGTIAEVFTPGYEMGEKVIQNAQVTVSNGELESEDLEDAGADADDADADADDDGSSDDESTGSDSDGGDDTGGSDGSDADETSEEESQQSTTNRGKLTHRWTRTATSRTIGAT